MLANPTYTAISKGISSSYSFKLRNTNDYKRTGSNDNLTDHDIYGLSSFSADFPLKKQLDNSTNYLKPRALIMYSHNNTNNLSDKNIRLDMSRIFTLDRIASSGTVEGGRSLALGLEFENRDLNNDVQYGFNIAQNFRDKKNDNLPHASKLNETRSDIVGDMVYKLNKNFEEHFKEYNFHKLYKELANFCSLELSAFYFDIRKDTLYCDAKTSTKRQATINLLGLILDMLLKWFAPVLSFTTEEIYQIINKDKNSSIHLESFPQIPENWKNEKISEKWEKFKIIRNVVNAAMEVKRANKDIGSSLEADIKVYLSEEYLKVVKDFDLSESFITSKAEAKKMTDENNLFQLDEIKNIKVLVKKAEGEKCPRCWKIFPDPCVRCSSKI